jgi:hypothetical protein
LMNACGFSLTKALLFNLGSRAELGYVTGGAT